MTKRKNKRNQDTPFGGVYIFAKNLKNEGQISSEGKTAVTHIETDKYSGKGSVLAKSTEHARKNEKLFRNPFFIIAVLSILIAFISIPWWPQFIHFINGNTSNQIKENNSLNQKVQQTPTPNAPQPNNGELRALDPLETNKDISRLPNGIYGYTYAFSITRFINETSNGLSLTNQIDKYKFEIQKINNEISILGFVDETTFSKMGEIGKDNPLAIMLFPINWKNDKKLISIPIMSFVDVSSRDIDLDQLARMSVLEGKLSAVDLRNIRIYRNDSN